MTTPHQPQPHTDGIPDEIMSIAETVCRTLSRTPLKDEAGVIGRAIFSTLNRFNAQPHTEGWQALMSPEAYRVVMHNARSIARGDHKRKPNWSFAMHLFSCGSTFGWKHCEFAEIDPDGVSVGEIWRRPSTTQSQTGR